MPVMQGTVEQVKSTIKSIEDNSQFNNYKPPDQYSIEQNVQNTQLSGKGCLGGSHKGWSSDSMKK